MELTPIRAEKLSQLLRLLCGGLGASSQAGKRSSAHGGRNCSFQGAGGLCTALYGVLTAGLCSQGMFSGLLSHKKASKS